MKKIEWIFVRGTTLQKLKQTKNVKIFGNCSHARVFDEYF